MNETLQKLAEKAAEAGIKTGEQLVEFIKVQTPDVLDEIVRWGIISEMGAPCIALLIMVACIGIHQKFKNGEFYREGDYDWPPGFILNITLFGIGLIIFVVEIMDILYPLVAPKLYILETLSKLVK